MTDNQMDDGLVGSVEAANILDVAPRTLDDWVYKGMGGIKPYGPDFYRVGRYRKYRPSELEAWIEAQRVKGSAQARA